MDGGLDPAFVWDVVSGVLFGVLTGEYITVTPAPFVRGGPDAPAGVIQVSM